MHGIMLMVYKTQQMLFIIIIIIIKTYFNTVTYQPI